MTANAPSNAPTGGPLYDRLNAHKLGPPMVERDIRAVRDGILGRMKIAARARFAANKRLEAKALATNFGLQTANLYTICIGILLLQFESATPILLHTKALNYVSLVASVVVQIVALVESYKDYSGKARTMHDCAIEINRIYQRMDLDPRLDYGVFAQYQAEYNEAIRDFAVNHDAIDFLTAQLEPTRRKARTGRDRMALLMWNVRYAWNVYALTAAILLLPLICYVPLQLASLW
jgi:SMODS and SLOG-associating 2TM effector domain family 5